MKRLLIICLLLAACNTPSPHFRGIVPTTVTVEGSTFDIRIRGLRAEAIRTNTQYAPRLGPIGNRAAKAISQVSGCKVHDFTGDQALIIARLDCGDGPPPKARRRIGYDCDFVDGSSRIDPKLRPVEVDCTQSASAY